MNDLRERIVEELIYERVLVGSDLLELMELERDMSASLARAIAEAAGDEDDALALTDRCIERVFHRLAAEASAALMPGEEEDDGGCPLCQAPLSCPSG